MKFLYICEKKPTKMASYRPLFGCGYKIKYDYICVHNLVFFLELVSRNIYFIDYIFFFFSVKTHEIRATAEYRSCVRHWCHGSWSLRIFSREKKCAHHMHIPRQSREDRKKRTTRCFEHLVCCVLWSQILKQKYMSTLNSTWNDSLVPTAFKLVNLFSIIISIW